MVKMMRRKNVLMGMIVLSLGLQTRPMAADKNKIDLGHGVVVRPFMTVDGAPVSTEGVALACVGNRIKATTTVSEDGVYRFGLDVEAPSINPLTKDQEIPGSATFTEPMAYRYPFDWEAGPFTGSKPELLPRLYSPGIRAGAHVLVLDTYEFTAINVFARGSNLVARFSKHRYYNDGGDRATADLSLTAGDPLEIELIVTTSIDKANAERFSPALPVSGNIVRTYYRRWNQADKAMGSEQYAKIAKAMKGNLEIAMVREIVPDPAIAAVFHAAGVKAFHYQFAGALRRKSAQWNNRLEDTIALKDSLGALYTAPDPNGSWALCDIRRPDVRARFVKNARRAIDAGYDGVFLDGYGFWLDAQGRFGANDPTAAMSLHCARLLLLREIKAEIRKANPQAVLGWLGNHLYDLHNEADFSIKERMYCHWISSTSNIEKRMSSVNTDSELWYEELAAPYVSHTSSYGAKGLSPIAVHSAYHFVRNPTGLWNLSTRDFFIDQLDFFVGTIRDIGENKDMYITTITPSGENIIFEPYNHADGITTIWAENACKIIFSIPVIVDGGPVVSQLSLQPQVRYRIKRPLANPQKVKVPVPTL